MNICLFTEDELGKPLSLRDERAKHLLTVLHKAEGDTFAAGVVGGASGTATITGIAHGTATAPNGKTYADGTLSFAFTPTGDGKPLHPLVMIIGFPRPIQLKRLLRDMASLGVMQVHLTGTELGEKSYLSSNLATSDAGYKMLLDGTVQAGSTHVPKLFMHGSLADCLAHLSQAAPAAKHALALDNVDASGPLVAYLTEHDMSCGSVPGGTPFAVAAIGSERGWTPHERTLLEQGGYTRLSMGDRILRTETAATTAASLILGAMGCLG